MIDILILILVSMIIIVVFMCWFLICKMEETIEEIRKIIRKPDFMYARSVDDKLE